MSTQEPRDGRLLTETEMKDVLSRLEAESTVKEGATWMRFVSYWSGEVRWARNRVSLASDRRGTVLYVTRMIRSDLPVTVETNQIDQASLQGVMRVAERLALEKSTNRAQDVTLGASGHELLPKTVTWNDTTYNRTAEENGAIVRQMTEKAELQGLLSAGYIEVQGAAVAIRGVEQARERRDFFGRQTQAQCSTTVRHPKGTGSGWAGLSGYDITKIDETALANRAFEKCLHSLNPVRIEPGRYTAVLEPQAVADLVRLIIEGGSLLRWIGGEGSRGPFAAGYDASVDRFRSKLGLKVVDERVTISHDPTDPELGVLPVSGIKPVTWIKNGVLTAMSYDTDYAKSELNTEESLLLRWGFKMSGGTATIEDMIAGTERGVLVTRFSAPRVIDTDSLLATGLTRDGLWLIEKGKVSRAVRNFRFTESPIFMLNNIEQMGIPVPVFNPSPGLRVLAIQPQLGLRPTIVPALKVRDFSFTSTVDAI